MNITVIGAGNMGGAIALAIAANRPDLTITVTNPSTGKLEKIHRLQPSINTTSDNLYASFGADIIILAVKPWILPDVIKEITPALNAEKRPVIVSVAGGVTLDDLSCMLPDKAESLPLFRVIPNTAITVGQGMTFISHSTNVSSEVAELIAGIFSTMGNTAIIPERLMDGATALSSCGIAYVFKFIQAMVQAGVELGIPPAKALEYANSTVLGAATLMIEHGDIPQVEIDRVTTPGGMTIIGINSLEHSGFTSAVINAVTAPIYNKRS